MDALSGILDALHLDSMVYEKLILSAPWGLDVVQDHHSQFWRLESGSCFLQIHGEPPVEMSAGDLIFVPHGAAHWISSAPESKRVPSATYVAARQSGQPMFTGQGPQSILIGGHFVFDDWSTHPFLYGLPKIMHITSLKQEKQQWLQQIAMLLAEEINKGQSGSQLIISRLAEVMFVFIIRAYMEQNAGSTGFLFALKDERISNSLTLMQQSPEKDWTINSLARHVGMSRTLFFETFKKLVGDTPFGYLTNWRMLKAKEHLLSSKENISEVAIKVGYQSEAAFNRIFKLKTGQAPASFRRTNSR